MGLGGKTVVQGWGLWLTGRLLFRRALLQVQVVAAAEAVVAVVDVVVMLQATGGWRPVSGTHA
jgi:hypothetical protein